MKINLTKEEYEAVQYMVWVFANGKVNDHEEGLCVKDFSLTKLNKLWEKIVARGKEQ